MTELLTVLTLVACALLFLSLFCYRREGARYRPGMAWLAWLLSGAAGSLVIQICSGHWQLQIADWPLLLTLWALTLAALRCRGNVARLFSIELFRA